jgi:hypothetical protein
VELAALNFQVVIDPTAPPVVKDAISFETGASPVEAAESFVYEHHGEGFEPHAKGALTKFYEDLILGTALPLTFATRKIKDVDILVAISLFLFRDLAIHPATPGLVAAVDLIHRYGPTFLGHVDADLARFLRGVKDYFPSGVSKQETGERLATATQWVREYVVDGNLPNIGPRITKPRIIEVGTNGFVLAEARKPTVDAWADLFRQGFLRGVMIGPADGDFRHVIASRKSERVEFNLEQAVLHLNELERLSGAEPLWRVDGDFLFGPPDGSLILVSHLLGVFLRV